MLTAGEMNGVLGMMPGFAAPDAVDIRATQTIAVDNLKEGVDKIIKDGVNDIATTGAYGGCASPNPREVVQKMNCVKGLGADGVLLRNHLAGRQFLGHGLPTILDGRSGQKKIRPTD